MTTNLLKVIIVIAVVSVEAFALPAASSLIGSNNFLWIAVFLLSLVGVLAMYVFSGQIESISRKYSSVRQQADETNLRHHVVLNVLNERLRNSTLGIQRHREFIEELATNNPDLQILQNEAKRIKRDESILLEALKDLEHFKLIQKKEDAAQNSRFSLDDMLQKIQKITLPYFAVKNNQMIYTLDRDMPHEIFGDAAKVEQILRAVVAEMGNEMFDGLVSVNVKMCPEENDRVLFVLTSDRRIEMDNFGEFAIEDDLDESSSQSIRMLKNHIAREMIKLMDGIMKVNNIENSTVCELSLPCKPLAS